MGASGLWSFVNSINFQIRQISVTNHSNPFSIKHAVRWVRITEKSINISGLKSPYHRLENRNLFWPYKKILQNSGYDHWHCRHITFGVTYNFSKVGEIMVSKYGIWSYQGHFQIKLALIMILKMKL